MVFSGILCIAATIMDWDWFMNHRRARLIVRVFGRMGARIFYCIFGVVFLMLGTLYFASVMLKG
jgi:hypothetical protein